MAPLTLPPIGSLPSLPDSEITAALDLLFEPSVDLHGLVLPIIKSGTAAQFGSYNDLISLVGEKLFDLARGSGTTEASSASVNAEEEEENRKKKKKKLHGILGSHPRLGASKPPKTGGKEEEEEELSEQSKAEQKQLRGGDPDEAEKLRKLNEEYEGRFPGLRYVVFVNGRGRDVVMEDMRRRIGRGDFAEEEREGIQAMCDIARDRAGKLLKAQGQQ